MATQELFIRQGERPFRDDINFPRGISRCGAFSISQSELLKVYGDTLKNLELGLLTPETEAEQQFVAMCRGERAAETTLEKLWLKYLSEIKRSRSFHTAFSINKSADNDGQYEMDDSEYAV